MERETLQKKALDQQEDATQTSRRKMIKMAAAGTAAAVAGATLTGCGDDDGGSNGDDDGIHDGPPPTVEGPVRWAMYLDLAKCTGCKACAVACKIQNQVPLGVWRREIKELEIGTFPNTTRRYLPWLCNQCDSAPCLNRCPVDVVCASHVAPDGTEVAFLKRATYKRPDGLVLVDEDRCIGCGNCVEDCPYGARFLNPDKPITATPAEGNEGVAGELVADKCNNCVRRVEGGVVPACVQTCPADALIFGDANEAGSPIAEALASASAVPLLESFGTEPSSRYGGLEAADVDAIFVSGTDVKDEKCALSADASCRTTGE